MRVSRQVGPRGPRVLPQACHQLSERTMVDCETSVVTFVLHGRYGEEKILCMVSRVHR